MTACERPAPSPKGSGLSRVHAATKPPVSATQGTARRRQNTDVNAWARQLIAAGGPNVPLYGSPEWHALPFDSPVRVASCVRAAEARATECDPEFIAWRLRVELDEMARMDADEVALDGWVPVLTLRQRADYARRRPPFSELCDRRGDHERAARARDIERGLDLAVTA